MKFNFSFGKFNLRRWRDYLDAAAVFTLFLIFVGVLLPYSDGKLGREAQKQLRELSAACGAPLGAEVQAAEIPTIGARSFEPNPPAPAPIYSIPVQSAVNANSDTYLASYRAWQSAPTDPKWFELTPTLNGPDSEYGKWLATDRHEPYPAPMYGHSDYPIGFESGPSPAIGRRVTDRVTGDQITVVGDPIKFADGLYHVRVIRKARVEFQEYVTTKIHGRWRGAGLIGDSWVAEMRWLHELSPVACVGCDDDPGQPAGQEKPADDVPTPADPPTRQPAAPDYG